MEFKVDELGEVGYVKLASLAHFFVKKNKELLYLFPKLNLWESFNMVNLAPYLATDHASINFHANLDFISRNKRFLSKRFICTAIVGGGISLTILWSS